LIIVAAGLVSYGVAELQEVGVLTGGAPVWDLSSWLGEQTVLGSFLKGLIAFQAAPTMLQVGVWLAYTIPTMVAFVRSNTARVLATAR
jgi:high-affinity iron transporter